MKKFLSTLAVFAMAAVVFTGCKKEDPKPAPTGKAKLSIPAALTVAPEGTAMLAITSSVNASADIAIEVKSSDATTVSAEPASVMLKKGTKSAEVTLKGLKEGSADITITTASADAEIAAGKCTVTVSSEPAPNASILKARIFDYEDSGSFFPIAFTSGDTDTGEYSVGGIFIHTTAWDGSTGTERVSIDNYGDKVVGKKESVGICFSAVAEGTEINNDLAWVENTEYDGDPNWFQMPYLKVDGMPTPLTGTVYVVFNAWFSDSDNGIAEDSYRVWAKINIDEVAAGNIANAEAYICTDNSASFKVGQKQ